MPRVRRRFGRRLAVGLCITLLGCRAAPPLEVEVEVRNVGFDQEAGAPVVILRSRENGRLLPIWIGPAEAQAIAMEIQKVAPPRPMTHDLVKRILDSTGVVLRRVRITELQQQTFFASLVLDQGGREVEIDSRPSDAIALALRTACPILVSRPLLESQATPQADTSAQDATTVWGLTVQDLTPALAESLGVAVERGVVVSDTVSDAADAEQPRRGDVIVAVDDTAVASVAELRSLAGTGGERRLEIRRGAARLVLRFNPRTPD